MGEIMSEEISICQIKAVLIQKNILNYEKALGNEYKDIQSQNKNEQYSSIERMIYTDSINLYIKAATTLENEDIHALHESFNVDTNYSHIKDVHLCRFRNIRLQIYNSIEKECKEIIKNRFPNLIA